MSNEKIYMPVEETDRMYREEKGMCLNDALLFLPDDLIFNLYKNRKVVHNNRENGVGVLTTSNTGLKKIVKKTGYSVYMNDKEGNVEWQSKPCLKLETALFFARELYKSLQEAYFKMNNKENTDDMERNPSYHDYYRVYSEMVRKSVDGVEEHIKIRHIHR